MLIEDSISDEELHSEPSQKYAGSSNLSMVIWGASLSHLTLNIEDIVASASAN